MSINVFTFTGNCGGDMEVRFTPNGKAIGAVNVPCKSGWGDNEKTTWVQCKMFGERAEKLAQYITKGSLVTVSGRLELDEWEHEGKKHSRVVCIVNDIQLGSKSEGSPNTKSEKQSQSGTKQPQSGEGINDFDDLEIPF